jgi:hypothetical protein
LRQTQLVLRFLFHLQGFSPTGTPCDSAFGGLKHSGSVALAATFPARLAAFVAY